jgi:DNA-3-methyladenine glycosylase
VLGLDGSWDGIDVVARGSALRLRPGTPVADADVVTGPRVGISRGADTPWRFHVAGNPCVSAHRRTGD